VTRTVDVVIAGDGGTARRVAVRALRRGDRVLIVLRSVDPGIARRLRTSLLEAAGADGDQLRVIAGAEVVCADGIDGVEAVVVRHRPSGRLSAVNASAFVSFTSRASARRAADTNTDRPQNGTNGGDSRENVT